MNKVIAFIFSVVLCSFYYSFADINSLIRDAYKISIKDRLNRIYILSFSTYNEGLYDLSEKNCIDFLRLSSKGDKRRAYILELLSNIYFRTKNLWSMENIVLKKVIKEKNSIPEEIQKKIFVNIYNLFLKKGKDVNELRDRFSNILEPRKNFDIPYRLRKFTPNVNIFKYKESRVFGENRIYFSSKNQTFYEIGYITDTGYLELKEANPLLDPFDIQKGMAVLIPRRRILPSKVNFGEIYINLAERRLYFPLIVEGEKFIITFPVGIGTDNAKSPVGTFRISQKRENPAWYVPENIRKEKPDLPKVVPPGENNPLGTRAMRLDSSTYLIHGTNKNFGVGLKVSHGCIRLFNRDVERLFEIVPVGTKVHIHDDFVKVYKDKTGILYLELHGKYREIKNKNLKLSLDEVLEKYIKKEKRGYAIPLDM